MISLMGSLIDKEVEEKIPQIENMLVKTLKIKKQREKKLGGKSTKYPELWDSYSSVTKGVTYMY